VATDPTTPRVPRITDIAQYQQEMFGTPHLEGAPSFYDYLENLRNIPRTTFSPLAWEVLTLNTEMMMHSMLVQSIKMRRDYEQKLAAQQAAAQAEAAGMSLDDLMATKTAMQMQMDLLDAELAKAAAEKV
jgi:hypothetical protein